MNIANDKLNKGNLLAKIRLDIPGEAQPRFLFGSKNGERAAEESREQMATLLRNIPLQGIIIEEIDLGLEVYGLYDTVLGEQIYYAPLIITLWASSIDDLIRFVVKKEFRKIDIIQPKDFTLDNHRLEKLLFRISEEIKLNRLGREGEGGRF